MTLRQKLRLTFFLEFVMLFFMLQVCPKQAPKKRDLLGASDRPTFSPSSFEMKRAADPTSQSLSGPLRAFLGLAPRIFFSFAPLLREEGGGGVSEGRGNSLKSEEEGGKRGGEG